MSSLFAKQKQFLPDVLTLPTYCVPNKESHDLAAKREARLQWMREKGMSYLGDPFVVGVKLPKRQPVVTSMRLVSVRKEPADVLGDTDLESAREA